MSVRRRHHGRRDAPESRARARDAHPARIYRELQIDGARFWTLFDSGARGTYATRGVAARVGATKLKRPVRRGLGGRVLRITEGCALIGSVEGYTLMASAFVADKLFQDEQGRAIDITLGMEAMETWGIGLDTAHKRLDFTHYQQESYEG